MLALLVQQHDHRTHVAARSRAIARLHNLDGGQAGQFVHRAVHGVTFVHVGKLDLTGHFSDDGMRVRVPFRDHLTCINPVAVAHCQFGTVRQLVVLALTAVVIGNG